MTFFLGLQQQRDELGHAEEADSLALAAGGDAEAGRQMRLAGSSTVTLSDVTTPLIGATNGSPADLLDALNSSAIGSFKFSGKPIHHGIYRTGAALCLANRYRGN